MKQFIIIITVLCFLWSCKEQQSKNETLDYQTTEELESTTVDSISNNLITNAPCIELQEFVAEIEELKWISDTIRLNKVGIYAELNRDKVRYFNQRAFYSISFESSRLNNAYKSSISNKHFPSLDYELFKGVKNIWGYYYRDKNATDWISDGVIEQWEFETEQQASRALKKIMQSDIIIYTNTNPYFCRIRNKLIIFQTRAMAFSHEQKAIFEKFVEEKEAKI